MNIRYSCQVEYFHDTFTSLFMTTNHSWPYLSLVHPGTLLGITSAKEDLFRQILVNLFGNVDNITQKIPDDPI